MTVLFLWTKIYQIKAGSLVNLISDFFIGKLVAHKDFTRSSFQSEIFFLLDLSIYLFFFLTSDFLGYYW